MPTLINMIAGSGSDVWGNKPVVPGAPDYMEQLRKTVSGDISLIPSVTDLASQSTALYKRLLNEASPGFSQINDLAGQQIMSGLRGELPKDVADQIARFSAEKAAGGGYSGSGAQANLTARDLGLNSLQLIQQNLGAAERWMQGTQSRTFDFSKMFYGPEEAMKQADANWNRDWLAAQVQAAPSPTARGEHDTSMAAIGMVMGAYAGGAGYQGYQRGNSWDNNSGGYQGNMSGGKDFQSYFGDGAGGSEWGTGASAGGGSGGWDSVDTSSIAGMA